MLEDEHGEEGLDDSVEISHKGQAEVVDLDLWEGLVDLLQFERIVNIEFETER